jgi:hypothetical protein
MKSWIKKARYRGWRHGSRDRAPASSKHKVLSSSTITTKIKKARYRRKLMLYIGKNTQH